MTFHQDFKKKRILVTGARGFMGSYLLISKLIGVKPKIEVDHRRIRGNQSKVMRLISDSSKAVKILGWQPTYTIEESLNFTIEWLKGKKEFGKTNIYSI